VVVLAVVLNVVGDTVVPVLLDDVVVSAVNELSETVSVEVVVTVCSVEVLVADTVIVPVLVAVSVLLVSVVVPVLVLLVPVVFVLVVTSYTTMVQAKVSLGILSMIV
jgi:hypothetical protein